MKNARKIILGVCLLLLGGAVLHGCGTKKETVKLTQTKSGLVSELYQVKKNNAYHTQSKQLADFVSSKMLTKKGIYTRYSSKTKLTQQGKDHRSILSESAGLWLQYLLASDQKEQFVQFYQQTKNTLYQEAGQFSYRYDPKKKQLASVNASLDDLRIMRALSDYDIKYHSKKYQSELETLIQSFNKHLLKNSGELLSFYDAKSKKRSQDSPLAYYDFKTLRLFEDNSAQGKKLYHKQLKLVQGGYLGDAFPLYAAQFNGGPKAYSTKNLNTSEALEVLLHLAEVGQLKTPSLAWLKDQVDRRNLRNAYTVDGKVVDSANSAGNYALAALIFAVKGNNEYYNKAMKLVFAQQVTEKRSTLFGALSQPPLEVSYSFNNLTSLLAAQAAEN